MKQYIEEAVAKLEAGKKASMGQHENVMKDAVAAQLESFCRQDGEFAQAVVQGGSFADCMKTVARKVHGNALSDIEAYRTAAAFYFPGCKIQMQMTIDLIGEAAKPATARKSGMVLDLEDFL